MARPRKCRRVCSMPYSTHFVPLPHNCEREVVMTVDEYETIRLIDYEELTQEECAIQMDIARTTVQAIYSGARRKLAECIVEGQQLKIVGGEIQICGKKDRSCGCCYGQRRKSTENTKRKGDKKNEPEDESSRNI